jgi:hypothetical protein
MFEWLLRVKLKKEREIGDGLISWLVGRYAVMVCKLPWKSLCWHC